MEVSTLPRRGGAHLSHPRQVLKAFGDDRLVDQIRRGNDAAFDVVYERHHRGILSYCRHMLSSQEEAEDAVQQAFVSAYYDIRNGEKDINLKPWLYTIARNRCLSMLRARREQPAELEEIPTAGLSEEVQHRDDLRRMLADLASLPVEQRSALVLSELGDLSHADIGAVLEVPTLKVKSLVFQARSALIESREARETPCAEIREQLATLRGGALRRGPLRKHLNACPGCQEFREDVRRQRAALAAILPVVPTAGLKGTVMAAIGGGGAAGGGAAGVGMGTAAVAGGGAAVSGSAGIGGVIALVSGSGTAKVATAVVLATGAAGGTAAVVSDEPRDEPATLAAEQARDARTAPNGAAGSFVKAPAQPAAEKKRKGKEEAAPTLVMGPDGTITVLPPDEGGEGGADGEDRKDGKGRKEGKSGKGHRGDKDRSPGRRRGNSNGENGTRTRAHGDPPKKGPKGSRGGRGATPAPQAAPEVAPPPSAPGRTKESKGKGDKGRGGKGPKAPRVALPLPD